MRRSATLFFFSSRRRHTRLVSDWSSDVCSSDLIRGPILDRRLFLCNGLGAHGRDLSVLPTRSEERRVGKECRSRGSPYHKKKTKMRIMYTDISVASQHGPHREMHKL